MSDPASGDAGGVRYDAGLAGALEARWQAWWDEDRTWEVPNPAGPLAEGWEAVAGRPKAYVLDMFPYPSGSGLHVGHPLGYIGTDVHGRFLRMTGRNVVHTIGYDAFGLPAEQYAVETGQHPRLTTEANIANMRRQLRRLGLAHDHRRAIATTDVAYVRWTQWIFLQIYNSWFDEEEHRARPIADLEARLAQDPAWAGLTGSERRRRLDERRLAYRANAMVNWCPGLGTVLANEEVTADGRSDRGNFPVYRRPLTQWMLRITAYADRLLADLDGVDWPEPVKLMQRNWIGRSTGAMVRFVSTAGDIEVFTTRPDTLFGATFMVLAPEHPLVDGLVPELWPVGTRAGWTGGHGTPAEAVAAYRRDASRVTDQDRLSDVRAKTGVFTGGWAANPATGLPLPVFVADYVLMGYGTGAIMAVPAQDERDWAFAQAYDLDVVRTVQPPDGWEGGAYVGEGPAVNSANPSISLDGLAVAEAKTRMTAWLEEAGHGRTAVTYKLRDWLFSRQRYWGEPFPIVYDEAGDPVALPASMLPVELPELDDFAPRSRPDDDASEPEPPLGRNEAWVHVELDLGDGLKPYRRELNTMPQWAGSCWYYLRYLDPTNGERFVDRDVERYWMASGGTPGGVDLYVGGVEHAVLHLLYSRFWHKVLFDLGEVSTPEPFQRLFNQGMIGAAAYVDDRGLYVPAADVVAEPDGTFSLAGQPVRRETGKMGKSLKNAVTPDEIYEEYGADTLRVYEMSMGPLDMGRPWNTRDIVGAHRLLQRAWRAVVDEASGEVRVVDEEPDPATARVLARTVHGVAEDYAALRFNTAVAKVHELVNHVTKAGSCPRRVGEALALLLAPLAPHVGPARPRSLGGPPALPLGRSGAAGRRHGHAGGAGQRQGPRPRRGGHLDHRRGRRGAGPRQPEGPGAAGRRRPPQGGEPPPLAGQRRRLTGAPRWLRAEELGHPEGEVEGLAGVEAGVAGAGVARVELVLGDVLAAAQALGDVVTGELAVDASRPDALGPAHLEEAGHLVDENLEAARLAAAGGGEGVAVHRVARPHHRRPVGGDGRHHGRQGVADGAGAHPHDEGEAAGHPVGVEAVGQRNRVLGAGLGAELHPERVADALEEGDVAVVELAGALADPEHVGAAVVPVAGERVAPGERLLVAQEQGFVGGEEVDLVEARLPVEVDAAGPHEAHGPVDLGGQLVVAAALGAGGDELLVPRLHPAEVGEAPLGEGPQQVQRRGGLVVRLQESPGVGRAGLRRRGVVVHAVAPEAGQLDPVDQLGVAGTGLGELAGDPADLHHGHAAAVGEDHGHLQDDLQPVADGIGREVEEGLGAVAGLEQERPALGDLAEGLGELAGLAGENQGRDRGQVLLGQVDGGRVRPDRLLHHREVAPRCRRPGLGHGSMIPRARPVRQRGAARRGSRPLARGTFHP